MTSLRYETRFQMGIIFQCGGYDLAEVEIREMLNSIIPYDGVTFSEVLSFCHSWFKTDNFLTLPLCVKL